jgi:hypothetical protein
VAALSDYISATRQFVRDNLTGQNINSQFYSDKQVIQWINKARDDIVRDTNCTREIALLPLSLGTERYSYSAISTVLMQQGLPVRTVLWIPGAQLQWTDTLKFALDRLNWAQFTAYYRSLPTFQSFPLKYCEYAQSIFVAPVPNQSYTLEVDTIWLPSALANTSDQETALYDPWIDLVPLRAASWLKYYQQSWQEADWLRARYYEELQLKFTSHPAFSVPSEYDNIDAI